MLVTVYHSHAIYCSELCSFIRPLFFSQRLLPENSEGEPEQYRKRQKRKAKAKSSDRDQELLVFGYEARIFHDNETATKIDNGKYLIAWQGRVEDPTLLDRLG
jgi:hypothetical protein